MPDIAQVAPFRLSDYVGQGINDATGMFRLSEAMQNAPIQRELGQQQVALGRQQLEQAPLQTESAKLGIESQKQKILMDYSSQYLLQHQALINSGVPEDQATAQVTQMRNAEVPKMVQQGLLTPEQAQQLSQTPFNPKQVESFLMRDPQYRSMLDEQRKIREEGTTPFIKELQAFQKMKPGDPGYEDMKKRIAKETAPPATTLTPTDLTNAKQMAHMIANYQVPPLSGFVMKSPYGQMVMSQVLEENPNYSAPEYHSRASAVTKFASGPQGNTIRSFNVAIQHLDLLSQLTDALQNGNVKQINRFANAYAEQTGQPAPTNFDAAKQVVLQEVIKAVSGSAGALGDRETADRNISRANSPQAIKGAINTYIGLMSGQLKGFKKQYEEATKLPNFNDKLAPETVKRLETETPTQTGTDIQNLLDKYAPVK